MGKQHHFSKLAKVDGLISKLLTKVELSIKDSEPFLTRPSPVGNELYRLYVGTYSDSNIYLQGLIYVKEIVDEEGNMVDEEFYKLGELDEGCVLAASRRLSQFLPKLLDRLSSDSRLATLLSDIIDELRYTVSKYGQC